MGGVIILYSGDRAGALLISSVAAGAFIASPLADVSADSSAGVRALAVRRLEMRVSG